MSGGARALLLLVSLLISWSVPNAQAVSTWLDGEAVVADADDRECRSSCPGDDENGECPPECDACPCCPSGVAPAVVSGELPLSPAEVHAELGPLVPSGRAQEGALSRVFHPPRVAMS